MTDHFAARHRRPCHVLRVVLLLGGWMLLPAPAWTATEPDQTAETAGGWHKSEHSPVLGGDLGTCFDVSVLKDSGKFRMWFSWRPKKSVALVESRDGVHWSEPTIVLGPNRATDWEADINRPVVVRRGDSYHMWYTGQARGHSWIGYATSPDGITWKRAAEKPVLSPDQPWEKVAVMCPNVLWDQSPRRYRMWYSGGQQYEPDAIGHATSRDGIHWEKHARNPVFQADARSAWEQHKVTGGQIVEQDGWYVMFYIGFRDVHHAQIGLARSRDGLTAWQRHPANPIVRPGKDRWDHDACYKPFAVQDGDRWLLWYNGRREHAEQIGLAICEGRSLWPEAADASPTADAASPAKPRACVGAYYFHGWSGKTNHITELLKTDFAARKPVWGWKVDTVQIMQKEIDFCADHSIAFWAFDWYYPETSDKETPLNDALGLYLKAPNRDRLKFCLLVANHGGFRIGPEEWDDCCRIWIDLFRRPTHLRLGDRPLLIFFSPHELNQAFGGAEGVRGAFASLRKKAAEAGIPNVAIAACTGPSADLAALKQAGYTLLTGYNYNMGWMDGGGAKPFRTLIEGSQRIFEQFANAAPLPYVPVITAGWDRRPWEQGKTPPEKMSTWYPDRTPKLIEEFVRLGVRWLDEHPEKTVPARLLLIYAWNENGEGGYLTPTQSDGTGYLKAVQRAVSK